MLLLLDLDNTLVDRTSAYKTWAADYVADHGADPADLDWLIDADRDGYEPRPRLAEQVGRRFGLPVDAVLAELRTGMVANLAWTALPYRPTLIADDCAAAIRLTGEDRWRP